MDGLLLFAHGARDPAWSSPFEAVRRHVELERPGLAVALAYLEFMQPDVEGGARELLARGCTRIHVVPLFLGASGHVRRDIPPLIDKLRSEHGERVQWLLQPAVGESEALVRAMAGVSLASLPVSRAEA